MYVTDLKSLFQKEYVKITIKKLFENGRVRSVIVQKDILKIKSNALQIWV